MTPAFPAVIISDAHTTTPCCEVWGIEQECGSAYANELRRISFAEFQAQVRLYKPGLLDIAGSCYSEVSKKAIREAEALVTR